MIREPVRSRWDPSEEIINSNWLLTEVTAGPNFQFSPIEWDTWPRAGAEEPPVFTYSVSTVRPAIHWVEWGREGGRTGGWGMPHDSKWRSRWETNNHSAPALQLSTLVTFLLCPSQPVTVTSHHQSGIFSKFNYSPVRLLLLSLGE